MDVPNPRRILAVSLETSSHQLSKVVKDLTGSTPEPATSSLAGTTHNLLLKTAYYKAEVPIWLDLISLPPEWSSSFLSSEAKEVLEVLGGLIIVFALPTKPQSEEAKSAHELIEHVGKVVKDGLGGWEWDGVGLCLGIGEVDDVDEWEDRCAECGLEFVQVRAAQGNPSKNEFGEKTGIPRALEALEANDWSLGAGDVGSDYDELIAEELDEPRPTSKDEDDQVDLNPESLEFGFDPEDFAGLKRAIWNAGEEDDEDFVSGGPSRKTTGGKAEDDLDEEDVHKIELMMHKLQAVRDMSVGLPEDQRKRMAAKAVGEVMKEL